MASFRVADAHHTVGALRQRGVPLLGPTDLPFPLDDDDVSVDRSGMNVAWMPDPDGNVLTVFSLDAPTEDINTTTLERANAAIVEGDYERFSSFCTDDTEWTFIGDTILRRKDDAVDGWPTRTASPLGYGSIGSATPSQRDFRASRSTARRLPPPEDLRGTGA